LFTNVRDCTLKCVGVPVNFPVRTWITSDIFTYMNTRQKKSKGFVYKKKLLRKSSHFILALVSITDVWLTHVCPNVCSRRPTSLVSIKTNRKLYAQLPSRMQDQARAAYQQCTENPHHSSFHLKRIVTQRPIYAVRVGRSYRAVGYTRGRDIT
jgi:hypothetical protein